MVDLIIIGAGFSGASIARVAAEAKLSVLVLERRSHVGGNAFDCTDAHGVLIHPYGPHIWHTNSASIHRFASRFTSWNSYRHRVLACVDGKLVPFPVNRTTINRLYGLALSVEEVKDFLEKVRVSIRVSRNSEDVVLSMVGRDLCDKFYRQYTRKQWGRDLSELAPSVVRRIPVRTTDEDKYFEDEYQGLPDKGYTDFFHALLNHPRIEVVLNADILSTHSLPPFRHLVYTGPIDAYFGYRFGPLPYRSIRFEHEHHVSCKQYQTAGVVNYPGREPFTRVTEFKHLTGQVHTGTSIVREFPQDVGEPLYPVPSPDADAAYKKYEGLARHEAHVSFVGRLARYRYLNMDQALGAALVAARSILRQEFGIVLSQEVPRLEDSASKCW